ncbi:autotransporter-associated beta strand repeat-containing protein [Segatella copri]|uniref:rhamnogalacturonan lyase family protein n=1 Tax=Segatella copri TaxID=165179 RepID=UPI001C44B0EE|nr:autotransporter-associated beta strand repeat-containing protein [Segatella copri]WOZ84458.1 autotransporter-associated beta strand repeat-containing protein [Segatella copri]
MNKKLLATSALALLVSMGANAQRFTDKLDRGLVAVKTTKGVYCSWRIQADEYYDVKYNLYRDGTKVNAEPLDVSNFTDTSGSESSQYTVKAVLNGVEQQASKAATVFKSNYKEIKIKHDASLKATYEPNDACCADVDGDGEVEILMKFNNKEEGEQLYPKNGPTINGVATKEYSMLACLKQDGTVLWWVNCGPNMGDFQNNEQNIVGYDWDMDGKAEVVMRLEEGSTVHMADGTTYTIGANGKNGSSWTNYREPKGSGSVEWFTHYGKEFLWYCEGATGKPYQCIEFPLKRLEDGETDLKAAWGDGYGHRSSKYFFGAPYLDGKHPSIFLGRGIYTRHKFIAYDVDPKTHDLKVRWKWTNNQPGSPWYGQGYHNYIVADVDWDGRDEIVWGSMVIDDNGKGLSTTGLGHGDAQHIGDFNPYIHGQEMFACNEDNPSNNYRDATTSKIYYRKTDTNDDGRCLAGNFYNDFPGAVGHSAHDTPISTVTNDHVSTNTNGLSMNFRIYWDGDLLEECFNNTEVTKPGVGTIATFLGAYSNNSTKATPCYQGDIFGDWREEVIERTADNNIRIYTTNEPTKWRNYSLWYDHQYRNGMVWQPCGYNQPPHVSYFLGELEGITIAPPPLTTTGREEVGSSISKALDGKHALLATTGDATVSVAEGASPAIFTDNAPSWVQGTAASECRTKDTEIKYTYYTHTLTGGAFTGGMRLVKQGDGTLVLPNVKQTYTGKTDVWAGTLQFDGTMESSPVWLNRFAELNSNGGNFKGGIKADYGSVIRPGGKENIGTLTTSSLDLGFGARVVFDAKDGNVDKLVADKMSIEKKYWKNGPQYNTPVFEFATAPAPGTYTLAEVGELTGKLSDIVVEGLDGHKFSLEYTDGKIVLNLSDTRDSESCVWTGEKGSVWDLMSTENFSSSDKMFVTGDELTFNDDAATSNVSIAEDVTPGNLYFKNDKKVYSLAGKGSILGEGSLNVEGTGTVYVKNTNKYSGGTNIKGGTLIPTTLANKDGLEYGSLGAADNTITLSNTGILKVTKGMTSSHPIVLGEDGGVINNTGTLILNGGIRKGSGKNRDLYKMGAGTLQLNSTADFDVLYINQGTVYDFQDGHFSGKTIVLNGSKVVLQASNSIYSSNSDNVNIEVPKGKSGIWYPDGRCDYTGKLTGEGTIDIYGTWIRCPFKGDWSKFEGTINAKRGSKNAYEPVFDFNNTYGIPLATLNVDSRFTKDYAFCTNGKSFAIGALTGSGYISNGGNFGSGANTLTIGGKNTNFEFKGSINGSNVVKNGTGIWTISSENVLANAKSLKILDGVVKLNKATATSSMTAPTVLYVQNEGELRGVGCTYGVSLLKGGILRPGSNAETAQTNNTGVINILKNLNAIAGSSIYVNKTKADSISVNAYTGSKSLAWAFLNVGGNAVLNGTIYVTYKDTWTPAVGDYVRVLDCAGSISGNPTFELQALPAGLEWDTTPFLSTGTIRVAVSTGIKEVGLDGGSFKADVYTIGGFKLTSLMTTKATMMSDLKNRGLAAGTYIVRTAQGGIKITLK